MNLKDVEARFVGECSVDSGMLMVGDPCYVLHLDGSEKDKFVEDFGENFNDFVNNKIFNGDMSSEPAEKIGNGKAVLLQNLGGDGNFPVYEVTNFDGDILGYFVAVEEFEDEENDEDS